MYVTPLQLAENPGALELSQVASDDNAPTVDAALMDAVLRGADTTAWPDDQVAAAQDALARINDAITDANALIDGFLARRGYTLPLNPLPPIVSSWARAITRYKLHRNRISDPKTDPIARDYQDAMKFLQLTANGQFSLGIGDTVTEQGAGDVQTIFKPNRRPGPWDIYE